MRSLFAVAAAVALGGGAQHITLTLDWTPNPDHVGFYDARATGLFARARLDVAIRAPSDPTAPLKLVGVGHSDLAVSYEQELFFAVAKKLPVVAVAAVVPQPLNSFMAIEPTIKSLHDLKGRTIGKKQTTATTTNFGAIPYPSRIARIGASSTVGTVCERTRIGSSARRSALEKWSRTASATATATASR